MELTNLQQTWNRFEQKLDQNRRLNLKLLRKVSLDKAKSKMSGLIWQESIAIFFYTLAGLWFMYFSATHWDKWHYVVSGAILALWSFIASARAVHKLQLILSVDYSMPVLQLQKSLMNIKISIIKNLRMAGWLLPFNMAFIIVGFEVFWGIDLLTEAEPEFLLWNGILSIGLIFVAGWIHMKLNPKNADKDWLNWLIQGSGSQVNDALEFLNEIDEFEKES